MENPKFKTKDYVWYYGPNYKHGIYKYYMRVCRNYKPELNICSLLNLDNKSFHVFKTRECYIRQPTKAEMLLYIKDICL